MSRLQYGSWEPDSAGIDTADGPGAVRLAKAENVYVGKDGYIPIKALAAANSTALPAACKGLFVARTTAGAYVIFAGTATKLYKYSAGAWTDYTRVVGGNYALTSEDYWSFAQFGSNVIAVNPADDPQTIDVDGVATAFSALGGTPPKARYVAVVGDFVVLGALTTNERKVRNSAINSAVGWTVGTNLCDEQEFADGGAVTGIGGGEFGWIMQETAIRLMTFNAGADVAFTFERVEKQKGNAAGYALVSTADTAFFLAEDGFYARTADQLVPIGNKRVNSWFMSNHDTARFFNVLGFADPLSPRVLWAFHNASTSTYFDRLLIYDWAADKWTYSTQGAQFWAPLVPAGVTLEGLDTYGSIDTLVPYSLDSRVWEGGRPILGAVNNSGYLAFLDGNPQTALFQTAPMQLQAGGRAVIKGVEPLGLFNDATISIRVGRRETTANSVSYTSAVTPSTFSGVARFKATGRFLTVEQTISQSSGSLWTLAQGIDLTAGDEGLR